MTCNHVGACVLILGGGDICLATITCSVNCEYANHKYIGKHMCVHA